MTTSKSMLFGDLPQNYKKALAQAILFTHPLQDHEFLIAGGVPLDFVAWLNIDNFTPSKLKDIDFVVKLEIGHPPTYYEDKIKNMNTKHCQYYNIKNCLSKVGN